MLIGVSLIGMVKGLGFCEFLTTLILSVPLYKLIGVSRSPGKRNWNWLYFLPFIFTFEQGELLDIEIQGVPG